VHQDHKISDILSKKHLFEQGIETHLDIISHHTNLNNGDNQHESSFTLTCRAVNFSRLVN